VAETKKISKETVHADFNDPIAVVHYARAAHFLGLWESERTLIARFFPDQTAPLLEAGCGAGRGTVGLWEMGYHNLAAFDFAEELLDQARSLATERDARAIRFFHADATNLTGPQLPPTHFQSGDGFAGALFLFNGLMQIPGRQNRRTALCELHAVCRPGAPLLFTTHDRDDSPVEQRLWQQEAERWARSEQDARLVEFGDRYFENEAGRTFMHLPDRAEILADLAATGWLHEFDAMRREVARESRAVLDFSDECRFWLARRDGGLPTVQHPPSPRLRRTGRTSKDKREPK
jgi:SAM-dependent methyltransferase